MFLFVYNLLLTLFWHRYPGPPTKPASNQHKLARPNKEMESCWSKLVNSAGLSERKQYWSKILDSFIKTKTDSKSILTSVQLETWYSEAFAFSLHLAFHYRWSSDLWPVILPIYWIIMERSAKSKVWLKFKSLFPEKCQVMSGLNMLS